jgi:hypothetical protein
MSIDRRNSEHVSDTTSLSGRRPDARGSEHECVERQAEEAQLATSETLSHLADGLKDLGDVKTVGSAGLRGLLVTHSIVSDKTASATQNARAGAGGVAAGTTVAPAKKETPDRHGSSHLASILSNVLQMATTAGLSAIRNAIAPAESKEDVGCTKHVGAKPS